MPGQENTLLLYCRCGFEGDCAAEIIDRAAERGITGYCRAKPGSGHVLFTGTEPGDAERLWSAVSWRELIFARQWLRVITEFPALPEHDRAGPIASAAVTAAIDSASELLLEYPDTNDGKALSRFVRKFQRPLAAALERQGLRIRPQDTSPRLHIFFLDSSRAFLGLSDPRNSAPWPLGIPRLRMPREAPSRSTLKLDEAIQSFLAPETQQRRLKPGATAVDLGAAPGGWSWQLARRGLHVIAVDNGSMDAALLRGGLVEHVRADGFRYRPPRPVDWLVCDIVEQPHRIARLMADWLARGDCRNAIFNLKLPMKRRYLAVRSAIEHLTARLAPLNTAYELGCKQLYHDREEVTMYVGSGTSNVSPFSISKSTTAEEA